MGETTYGKWEVEWLIAAQLAEQWPGNSYDLLRRNCCHFCEEFAEVLAVAKLPSWMNSLANTGAALAETADKVSKFRDDMTRERSKDRGQAGGGGAGAGSGGGGGGGREVPYTGV